MDAISEKAKWRFRIVFVVQIKGAPNGDDGRIKVESDLFVTVYDEICDHRISRDKTPGLIKAHHAARSIDPGFQRSYHVIGLSMASDTATLLLQQYKIVPLSN